ncbi:hypothetical protein C770_GR4pC1088 (plasmid) [Sinorhizobium meliloti GR4]|nr:hypothetical protein C770_GR4pC1088 [Sinorhizobium meliloti GR4]
MAESPIAINSLTTLAAAKPGRQPPLVILFLIIVRTRLCG